MYLLFREYHLLPPAVMKLGYGERQVLYAFIRYEMEEKEKKSRPQNSVACLFFIACGYMLWLDQSRL